jgi:hypothetical protein
MERGMMASLNERAGLPLPEKPGPQIDQQFPFANLNKEIADKLSTASASLIGLKLLLPDISESCDFNAGVMLCEVCGYCSVELFGYRQPDKSWRWFCSTHRIGQFYADKRLPAPDDVGGDQ